MIKVNKPRTNKVNVKDVPLGYCCKMVDGTCWYLRVFEDMFVLVGSEGQSPYINSSVLNLSSFNKDQDMILGKINSRSVIEIDVI